MITRTQAMAAGLTARAIEMRLTSGAWQRMHRGVYATFTGVPDREARLWAAVLAAGRGAMLSYETAAEVAGMTDAPKTPVHVTIPADRRVAPLEGVRLHLSLHAEARRHPGPRLPRTRIEETVLDLVDVAGTPDRAIAWVALACGRRLTTGERLEAALAARPRVRWRRLLGAALRDAANGAHSLLEVRYLRDVERAHRLPAGDRQHPLTGLAGRIYQDIKYAGYGTVVELDGVIAHPISDVHRDLRRDNVAAVAGDSVLHYGWSDVTARPCEVALQVGRRLALGGWDGPLRVCARPDCMIAKELSRYGVADHS